MLAGKKIVVVGGSSGIGLSTAELGKRAAMPEEARKNMLAEIAAALPVGRVGTGEDVARQILAFMTIGFATGSIVYLDGGALVT